MNSTFLSNLTERTDYRITFVLDPLLWLLFVTAGGAGWIAGLLAAETVMWMVRLLWISPMMLRFILRRLVHMIPIVLAVVAIGFGLIQLAPGDVFTRMLVDPNIRPEDVAMFRQQFGLDQPWYVQFFRYIWNALRGNFGYSMTLRAPVFFLVQQRAAATILLSVTSLAFAWIVSVPFGIIAATNQYKWKDQLISFFAFFGLAIPNFFLAFLLLYIISTTGFRLLPIGGMTSIDHAQMSAVGQFIDIARHLVLPAFVIGTSQMAQLTRYMRGNMLEIMNQQYIVTARAKGQTENKVIYRHALRNAINPMITILGFQLGLIMSGAALVENVIGWPGLGRLILEALLQQDMYMVIGSLIYGVILLVIGNLFADILLAVVDPRIRVN
ncbi:MAG: ABC transporter permease [Spirochaeta sp.]